MPIDPASRLLEVNHVAIRLSVSQRFVWRLIREQKLAAIRLGARWRIDPDDLKEFLDAQRRERAVTRFPQPASGSGSSSAS